MTCKKCKTLRLLLQAIYELVCGEREAVLESEHRHHVTAKLTATLPHGFQVTGTEMLIISRVDEKIVFSPTFTDKFGNTVTEFGGPFQWATSDATLAALEVSADGNSASLTPTGLLGTTTVSLKVDADPDADYEEVGATADVTFKPGKAVIGSFTSTLSDVTATPPVEVPTPTPVVDPAPAPAPAVDPTPAPTVDPTPVVDPAPAPAVDPTPVPVVDPTPAPVVDPAPAPAVDPTPAPVAVDPAPTPAVDPTTPVPEVPVEVVPADPAPAPAATDGTTAAAPADSTPATDPAAAPATDSTATGTDASASASASTDASAAAPAAAPAADPKQII